MIGIPPISIIGLGLMEVSSANLDPNPPASITTFIKHLKYLCAKDVPLL